MIEKPVNTVVQPNKVTIQKGSTQTHIVPTTDTERIIAKAIYDIQETGMPTNDDLDHFGDQVITFFEQSRVNIGDEKTTKIVDSAQKVVEDVQLAISVKNYDGKLQDITRKLKETPKPSVHTVPISPAEGEEMSENFRGLVPLIANLGKNIIRDREFRELIVSILDVLESSYSRVRRSTDETSVKSTLKEEVLDTSNVMMDRTRNVISKKLHDVSRNADLTEGEREELINKSVRLLIRVRAHTEYRSVFENLFRIYDGLTIILNRVKTYPGMKESVSERNTVLKDMRVLFERTSGRSLDKFIRLIREFTRVRDDVIYKNLRIDIEDLVLDRQHKYQTEFEMRQLFRKIRDEGYELNNLYNGVLNDLVYEIREMFYGIANDPIITKIKTDLTVLFREIFTDNTGRPSVYASIDSITRLKDAFFPILKERLAVFELPIIELESKKYFFRIADLKLSFLDLVPEQFQIDSDTSLRFDTEKLKRRGHLGLRIRLEPFTTKFKNIRFYMKKKTGMKYKDYGKLNIYLKKAGIYLDLLVLLRENRMDKIEVVKVSSNLSGLKVKIKEAKHNVLDKIATGVFLPIMRGRLEKMINARLYDKLENEVCYRINDAIKEGRRKEKAKLKVKREVKHEGHGGSEVKIKEKREKNEGRGKDAKIKEKREVKHEGKHDSKHDTKYKEKREFKDEGKHHHAKYVSHDPKFVAHDTKYVTHDPKHVSHDPKYVTHDPKYVSVDPKFPAHDPRYKEKKVIKEGGKHHDAKYKEKREFKEDLKHHDPKYKSMEGKVMKEVESDSKGVKVTVEKL